MSRPSLFDTVSSEPYQSIKLYVNHYRKTHVFIVKTLRKARTSDIRNRHSIQLSAGLPQDPMMCQWPSRKLPNKRWAARPTYSLRMHQVRAIWTLPWKRKVKWMPSRVPVTFFNKSLLEWNKNWDQYRLSRRGTLLDSVLSTMSQT